MSNFDSVLDELRAMHNRKQADYGRTYDPFANVRASEDFGIEGWVGSLIRANDKMRRLQKAATGDNLVNESVEDSLIDLAVYTIISLILFREQSDTEQVVERYLADNSTTFRTYADYVNRPAEQINKIIRGAWDGFDFTDD